MPLLIKADTQPCRIVFQNGLTAAIRSIAAYTVEASQAAVVDGRQPPLVDASDAALQLHQTCRSGGAQHFRGASDRHAGKVALNSLRTKVRFF